MQFIQTWEEFEETGKMKKGRKTVEQTFVKCAWDGNCKVIHKMSF